MGFADGSSSDPSLNVIGTSAASGAGSPVLTATAGSQSGNLQEWRNSGGTALATVSSTGSITTTGAAIGYATGAGGTVTQATNKSNGVTINKITGLITMNNASLAANTTVAFTVTNSTVAATDVPVVAISGAASAGYQISVTDVSNGSFRISLLNATGGALVEAVEISFVIIKGVTN